MFTRLSDMRYNKYGNEIYKLVQAGSDRIYEYRTSYTYNDRGQLSAKKVAYAMDGRPIGTQKYPVIDTVEKTLWKEV